MTCPNHKVTDERLLHKATATTERQQRDNVGGEARVAELADALALGASSRKGVEVRVLSRAPKERVCLTAIHVTFGR